MGVHVCFCFFCCLDLVVWILLFSGFVLFGFFAGEFVLVYLCCFVVGFLCLRFYCVCSDWLPLLFCLLNFDFAYLVCFVFLFYFMGGFDVGFVCGDGCVWCLVVFLVLVYWLRLLVCDFALTLFAGFVFACRRWFSFWLW